ncbi:MAG: FliH/SctL family protein [Lachnospiraceae bacterium]
MSNLIKSGFVSFSQDQTLVIDANKNKVIKGLDQAFNEASLSEEDIMEEAIAEAMIHEAGLEEATGEALLTMDTEALSHLSEKDVDIKNQVMDELLTTAKNDAEEIVNRAHDEAEQLRAAAYDEAEAIREQARVEGYDNGYQEGVEAASREYAEKEREINEHLKEKERWFQEKEEELIKETEKQMVDWLCQMIPQITGVVLDGQRDVLLYMVNSAMRDLDNSKHFVIKVSTDDYEEIAERKEEIYGAGNPNIELEVYEDAKLAPMQCLIETDNGIVDVSLDVQFDNLNKALRLMIKE